jgi:general secretion pathway protein L
MVSSSLQATMEVSRRFFAWWGDELAELVPAALRRWALREAKRSVLAVEDGSLVHYEESGGKLARRGEAILPLGEAAHDLAGLAALGRRSGGPVGIRLPRSACLIRRIELPAAARRDFDRILKLDLERSTPFRVQDIYCDHVVEDGPARNGKIWVRQIVVKRELLDPIMRRLAAGGIAVDFADCWDEAGKQALPVDLLRAARHEPTSERHRLSPAVILAVCAFVLAGSAVAIGLARYEAALQSLEAETDAAKAKALAVRRSLTGVEASLGQVSELRRLKTARPPAIRVLDELTRLLPDGAWVNYLKIEGDAVEVTIVAPATGELLPLFERSPLFAAATLTAPVTYDAAGQSERATVRMMLRPVTAPARAVRASESKS